MRKMRAKFKCEETRQNQYNQETAKLYPVYQGENPENDSFSEATPQGSLEMVVTRAEAKGYFEPGKEYYLDFSEAE
jgi:hypothetical protein